MLRCPNCGRIAVDFETTMERTDGSRTVLFEGVPCIKCEGCEEEYIPSSVLEVIDRTMAEISLEETESGAYYRIYEWQDLNEYGVIF